MEVKSTVFQLEFAILHIPQEQLINHMKKKIIKEKKVMNSKTGEQKKNGAVSRGRRMIWRILWLASCN